MNWKTLMGVGALALLAIVGAQASGTAASAGAALPDRPAQITTTDL